MTRTRTARILRRTALGVAGFLAFLSVVLGFFVSPDAVPTTELPDTPSATTPAEGPTEPVAPAEPSLGAEVAPPAPAAPAERDASDVAWAATAPRIADAGTWDQYDDADRRLYADRLCDLRAEQGSWTDAQAWLGVNERAAADMGQALALSGYCTLR